MVFVGIGFIAAAIITFWLAKPHNGVVKLENNPLLGDIVALSITVAGAIGIVMLVIGLGNIFEVKRRQQFASATRQKT